MEPMDQGIDSAVLLEAEIDGLMRRLIWADSNAILRLEILLAKIKSERVVIKQQH